MICCLCYREKEKKIRKINIVCLDDFSLNAMNLIWWVISLQADHNHHSSLIYKKHGKSHLFFSKCFHDIFNLANLLKPTIDDYIKNLLIKVFLEFLNFPSWLSSFIFFFNSESSSLNHQGKLKIDSSLFYIVCFSSRFPSFY